MELVDPAGRIVRAQDAINVKVASLAFGRAGSWKLQLRSPSPAKAIPIQSIGVTAD